MRIWPVALMLVLPAGAVASAEEAAVECPVPLVRAHAHNDYMHKRPLLDALDNGFCSVEADIHLVDGQLLVAHDREDTRPERTLQKLYLDPLRERVKANGGTVYPNGPGFTLLIDIKGNGEATYAALHKVLEEYADVFTCFRGEDVEKRAAVAIISGSCPRDMIASQSVRYAGIDGRTRDLDSDMSPNLMPLISDNWSNLFSWRGNGAIPEDEREKLGAFVQKAHAKGRRARFWGLPWRSTVWPVLYEAGVDLINTDNLKGLGRFLLERQGARAE